MSYGPKPRPLAERFWSKVDKNGTVPVHAPELGPCWVWTASKRDGYGQIGIGSMADGSRDIETAHRVSWFLEHGKWPKLFVLHKCDNRACVRPTHLFLGNTQDNTADRVKKSRTVSGNLRGELCGASKLTESQAAAIIMRKLAGERTRVLAEEFGISMSQVQAVGVKCWLHLIGRQPVRRFSKDLYIGPTLPVPDDFERFPRPSR